MANRQPPPLGLAVASSSKVTVDTPPLKRHRRRLDRRRPSGPAPSSSALAALATLATSATTADGRPLSSFPTPPPFLCPFIESAISFDPSGPTPAPEQTASYPEPTPSFSCQQLQSEGHRIHHHYHHEETPTTVSPRDFAVPDHWQKNTDGLWHRTDDWELYGSSKCGSCSATISVIADAVSATSVLPTSTPTKILDFDSLPKGWTPKSSKKAPDPRNAIIISVSLLLTCVIVSVIVTCVLWRRRRKRRKDPDLERIRMQKLRDKYEREAEEMVGIDHTRTTQKLWMRASARWKANVRTSARRRRARRLAFAAKEQDGEQASPAISQQHRHSSDARSSRRSSVNLSRTSSPLYGHPPSATASASSLSRSFDDTPASRTAQRSSNPPAYLNADALSTWSSREGHPSLQTEENPFNAHHGDESPPVHRWDTAHIAIDDKRRLAEFSRMRSVPPEDAGQSSNPVVAAVPIWHDEDINDLEQDTPSTPPPPPPASAWPALPEKGPLAASMLESYISPFEDDGYTTGPSLPGLGEIPEIILPSAPPVDDSTADAGLAPSAPPLSGAEDNAVQASAPLWPNPSPPSSHVDQVAGSALERFSHRQEHDAVGDTSLPTYRP